MRSNLANKTKLALYLHIPFCLRLCHYCDFAKTARFEDQSVDHFFTRLEDDLHQWLQEVVKPHGRKIVSLFVGGGTPGLFTKPYRRILEKCKGVLEPGCEITLETNPETLTEMSLDFWRSVGFTRLSVGVQSFDPLGLKVLTRTHLPTQTYEGLQLAGQFFEHLNLDLIYGWHGQTLESWNQDLQTALELPIDHLSLYCLTYEGRTPFGYRYRRGAVIPPPDETLVSLYEAACRVLAIHHWDHYEVSNWARAPENRCRQNEWIWSGGHYLGVGPGAHGFLESSELQGLRYSYSKSIANFSAPQEDVCISQRRNLNIDQRSTLDWLLEHLATGLRSDQGFRFAELQQHTSFQWRPTTAITRGLVEGLLIFDAGHLKLSPSQWFIEQAWVREVSEAIVLPERSI